MLYEVCGPYKAPRGEFTFQLLSAESTSFSPIRFAASLSGSSCTRTANFCAPITCTCATPFTIEMRGATTVSANSSSSDIDIVLETRLRKIIGSSAGLDLRNDGGDGIPGGSSGVTSAIAVCTSTAAPSMSRSRSSCSVTLLLPVELRELIESRPAMPVNCRSSTVATADDIVFGSAPG